MERHARMKLLFSPGKADVLKTGLLVIPVSAEGPNRAFDALDTKTAKELSARAEKENFKGGKDRTLIWEGSVKGGRLRIMAVGVGSGKSAEDWRWGLGRAIRFAVAHSITDITVLLDAPDESQLSRISGLTAEAVLLSNYQFNKYKSKAKRGAGIKQIIADVFPVRGISDNAIKAAERSFTMAKGRAEAVMLARDLVNEPANILSPAELAVRANGMAEQRGLECTILTEKDIKKQKMGLLMSVAEGSDRPPRFIHLVYRPRKRAVKRAALVGKGITFDTGGLCLKPGKSMYDMKTDMAGAATVLGIMSALKSQGVRAEVHGIIPVADNGVNGSASRPGDVFKSLSGKTVEVLNTDAEGRLVLADAMTFACRLKPDIIVDYATLTGACEVALGSSCAGLFSNRDENAAAIETAAQAVGESLWRLPLLEDLEAGLKSDIADLKNIGGRFGGAVTAALFLQNFSEGLPWMHLDIAGPARLEKAKPYCPKGATGFGVLTGLAYLSSL
jgi:leucyl aminopeptidase